MEELELIYQKLDADLQRCKDAITYRGGTISSTMGFKDLKKQITTLPSSNSCGTVINEEATLYKSVPVSSTKYCYLKSLGGRTYKCNNLIPFPYLGDMDVNSTTTMNGITIKINSDHSFTLNGTCTENVSINFTRIKLWKGTFTYTASGIATIRSVLGLYDDNGAWIENIGNVNSDTPSRSFEITVEQKQYNLNLNFHIYKDEVLSNVRISPMLNVGSTALAYEPYYEGLRDTKPTAIKAYGAQLIPFPYYDNKGVGYTYTESGVTFTVNADRSITIDTNGGTSRGVSFLLANYLDLPSGSYTITAYRVGGTWTGDNTNSPYVSGTGLGGKTYPISTRPTATISTKPVWYSINVPNGAVVDNVTLKVMLNKGSIAVPYQDYHEPVTYLIPEALQGTGKGVEGAADTIDFENGEKLIKTKTVALADENYNLQYPNDNIRAWQYIKNCANITPFNTSLAMSALCSNLPTTSVYNGTEVGVCLEYKSSSDPYISIAIPKSYLAEMSGDNDKAKLKNWLKENNVTLTYAVAELTTEDIDTSDFDNLIEVEGGGSLEIITDNGMAVPTTLIYQTIM